MAYRASIDAYFERLGFVGSIAPTLETLGQLHAAHIASIPFENLDPLLGVPVRLELPNLEHKLIFDRRGGHGLEHNLLLKAMLADLDFEVELHSAHVLWGGGEGDDDAPDHVVLTIDFPSGTYLVDVGFGGLTPSMPLRLRDAMEQQTPHELFRIASVAGNWQVEAQLAEGWRPLYRFDRAPCDDRLIAEINERVSTAGPLTRRLLAGRVLPDARLLLRDNRFTLRRAGAEAETQLLETAIDLRAVLSQRFGIALPPEAALDTVLGRFATGAS